LYLFVHNKRFAMMIFYNKKKVQNVSVNMVGAI
jgi:hypothetical protein